MTEDRNQFGRLGTMPAYDRYEPRVGSSRINYVIAGVLALLAAFAGLASAGGSSGAGGFASACVLLAAAFLLWAGISNYVRKIELRLIDIQKAIETK